jgi:polysaccharide export outer membrane protein
MNRMPLAIRIFPILAIAAALLTAQTPPGQVPALAGTYILGPGDEVVVKALDVEEIKETPTRIDMRGEIRLPLIGTVHAAGLTAEDLESVLKTRLKKYLMNPDVIVSVGTFRSQPVMVLGAVTSPGVHQLEGRKTLFEVISEVGGVRADGGHTIKITRRKEWGPIPLPGAAQDPTGQFYVAEVTVKSVMEAKNPTDNIEVKPRDIITVPKAQIVYVVGAVKKAGGYALGDAQSITVVQALALAEGLDKLAAPQNARVMRVMPGSSARTEIPVDVKKIFAGKGTDVELGADDILFIPNSGKKAAMARGAEAALAIGSGVAIYGVRP